MRNQHYLYSFISLNRLKCDSNDDEGKVLPVISQTMLSILEACVYYDEPDIAKSWESISSTTSDREQTLQDMLVFVNVLVSSSKLFLETVLSEPKWFKLLLKVINTTGETGKSSRPLKKFRLFIVLGHLNSKSFKTYLVGLELLKAMIYPDQQSSVHCDEVRIAVSHAYL